MTAQLVGPGGEVTLDAVELAQLRPYARDAADRMRVLVDAGTVTTLTTVTTVTTLSNISTSNAATYYGAGGFNAIDAREQLAAIANANFLTVRSRWTFS